MKRVLIVAALLFLSPACYAGNYATCLLDKLQGVKNSTGAYSVKRLCGAKYPGGMPSVERGSALGFFSRYKTPDECFYAKGKKLTDRVSASLAMQACRVLYSKPEPEPKKLIRLQPGTCYTDLSGKRVCRSSGLFDDLLFD